MKRILISIINHIACKNLKSCELVQAMGHVKLTVDMYGTSSGHEWHTQQGEAELFGTGQQLQEAVDEHVLAIL